MSKSIPVTDGTNVIYTIELKKDFGDLCKELTRLKISPDQKLCIVTDSNYTAFTGGQQYWRQNGY